MRSELRNSRLVRIRSKASSTFDRGTSFIDIDYSRVRSQMSICYKTVAVIILTQSLADVAQIVLHALRA
jgi:hypothetical protein